VWKHIYLTLSMSLLVSIVCAFHYDHIDLCEVDSAVNKRLTDYIREKGMGSFDLVINSGCSCK